MNWPVYLRIGKDTGRFLLGVILLTFMLGQLVEYCAKHAALGYFQGQVEVRYRYFRALHQVPIQEEEEEDDDAL